MDMPRMPLGSGREREALAVGLSFTPALWQWVKQRLRAYRDVAPLVGLAYAWWSRHAAEAELREGRFMQQCTFLLVDVEGLRKTNSELERVTVPTLFSRTLRALVFENAQMAKLVSDAAARTTPSSPLLSLGSGNWLVMANINAHILEVCGAYGHTAAICGHEVDAVEVLYALVNDRETKSRQQLRVYLVRESQLRELPAEEALDLRRNSRRSAFSILQKMAAVYRPPPDHIRAKLADPGVTSGLPSGMGRTWICFPRTGPLPVRGGAK